jgi:hypothetical protein
MRGLALLDCCCCCYLVQLGACTCHAWAVRRLFDLLFIKSGMQEFHTKDQA